MSPAILLRIAASFCFLAVALGAFGAHGLKGLLLRNDMLDVWNKAALYHLAHAIALLVLALQPAPPRAVFLLLALGIVFFSGSLYAMSVTNVRVLGAITPIGGLLFLAGWAWLALAPPR